MHNRSPLGKTTVPDATFDLVSKTMADQQQMEAMLMQQVQQQQMEVCTHEIDYTTLTIRSSPLAQETVKVFNRIVDTCFNQCCNNFKLKRLDYKVPELH